MSEPVDKQPSSRPRRPKHKRRHRAGAGLTATMVFATFVLVVSVLVLSGRVIPFPEPLEEAMLDALNARIDQGDVDIGDVGLSIIDGSRPRLRLRDVAFRGPEGGRLAELNEVLIDVSVGALLQGRVRAERVSINGAQITVRRAADGQFRFGMPSDEQAAQVLTLNGLLSQLDRALRRSLLAAVGDIDAQGVVITLEDARSGRLWQATNARLLLRERADGLSVSVSSDVFNGTDELAEVQFSFAYNTETRDTSVGIRLVDVPAADMSLQSPAFGWLSVLQAPISGAVRVSLDGDGRLASLDGTFDIEEGVFQPETGVTPVAFDAASAYFAFDPDRSRIDFNQIGIQSDIFSFAASGHAYLEEAGLDWSNTFVGQFDVSEAAFLSDSVFPAPISVDRVLADLRLTLAPFSIDLADVLVEDDDVQAFASGRIETDEGRWRLSLDTTTRLIGKDRVLAFWPLAIAPGTRGWLDQNLIDGQIENVSLGVRHLSGSKPDLSLSFDYQDVAVRYLKSFPVAEDGRGRAELHNSTFTLEVDDAWIEAPSGGAVSGTGTVFSVADVKQKPARASLSLAARGELEPILEVIDLPPLNLMTRAGRDQDIAQADVLVEAEIALPLKRGLTASDIAFEVDAFANNINSERLVPGRNLTAPSLTFSANEQGIEISGAGRLDGMPFDTVWSRSFAADVGAQSTASGRATLTGETLAAFGVRLPDGLISGQTEARYDLEFSENEPPSLRVASNLRGLALNVPALGWRKPAAEGGDLQLAVALGETPDVRRLALSAPGLSLNGDVELDSAGALRGLILDQLQVGGWLDVSAFLEPSTNSAPPKVGVLGGRLDLRNLPERTANRSAASQPMPISVVLDSVAVSDGITLAPFRGEVTPVAGGLNGSFEARLAGRTEVRGGLLPAFGRTALRLESDDAGGVLRDAGLTPNGRDGSFSLTLTPIRDAPAGHYDGKFLIKGMRLVDAPLLAGLLDAISVVGLIDELAGSGIWFDEIDGAFRVTPERVTLSRLAGVGPSLGISAEGVYDTVNKQLEMQGVVSPVYFVNAIGAFLTRRGEGLLGFNYTLSGPTSEPSISVNPLSILTPGMFREIFRIPIQSE